MLSDIAMQRRCIALSLMQEYTALPPQPSLVPTADGALEAIVFTIPAYAVRGENNPLWKVYKDLILKLPEYTHLYILTHQSVEGMLKQWLEQQNLQPRVQLGVVSDAIEMTVWAEDDFELVYDQDGSLYLLQPHSSRRSGDELASYYACERFGWNRAKVPVYFEGGNLLVGDDFFFLGANYAVDTFYDFAKLLVQDKDLHLKKAMTQVYQQYLDKGRILYFISTNIQLPVEQVRSFNRNGEEWKEVLHLKNGAGTVQPIFHIDMFITLAGRNEDGKYQVLVGDPKMASELLGDNHAIWTIPEAFDDIAALLTRLRFEVIRNPLPLTYVDDEQEKVRKWYFATYNNALVEIKGEADKTVWLPTYGYGCWQELKHTDEENKTIWQHLGFKVVMLEDFHPFAEYSGAVHCIKKYMRRGDGQPTG